MLTVINNQINNLSIFPLKKLTFPVKNLIFHFPFLFLPARSSSSKGGTGVRFPTAWYIPTVWNWVSPIPSTRTILVVASTIQNLIDAATCLNEPTFGRTQGIRWIASVRLSSSFIYAPSMSAGRWSSKLLKRRLYIEKNSQFYPCLKVKFIPYVQYFLL